MLIKIDTSGKVVNSNYINRLLSVIRYSDAQYYSKYTVLKNSIKIYWSYDISEYREQLQKQLEEIE